MAYQKDFVVSVIHNGKPVREFNESGNRTCRIPFNSEYKLRVKSKTWKKALVSISIDGTDVLTGGKQVILNPYQSVELERFVDDLNSGKKFKFISVEQGAKTGEVQDPTAEENGLIRVQIYPEIDAPVVKVSDSRSVPSPMCDSGSIFRSKSVNSGYNPIPADKGTITSCVNSAPAPAAASFYCGSMGATMDFCDTLERALHSDKGATAEGSHSSQQFQTTTVSWEVEKTPITFDIWLKGVRGELAHSEQADWLFITLKNGQHQVKLGGQLLDVTSCRIANGSASVMTRSGLAIETKNYQLVAE